MITWSEWQDFACALTSSNRNRPKRFNASTIAPKAPGTPAVVEGVVNQQMHSIGGELPVLIAGPNSSEVVCINGNMIAPEQATPKTLRDGRRFVCFKRRSSQTTAVFYSRLSPEGRRRAGGEEPEAILKAMSQRILGMVSRFKVPQEDALVFSGIAKKQGMEAYARAQFPDQFLAKK